MKTKTKKRLKITAIVGVLAVLVLTAAFYLYVSDYYVADEGVTERLQSDTTLQVLDRYTILSPSEPTDTAFIFYPGAKVEAIAYLPILEQLTQNGVTCILVEMPFNMAIFDKNAAEGVYELLPEITNWYIGGHSMGGAMASSYASDNQDRVQGLVLLGAYVYGDYPPEKALTIYGTFNSNLEENINYTENIVIIEGGNHAQFGNYGPQKGDPAATITHEEQQAIAVAAIVDFMKQFCHLGCE